MIRAHLVLLALGAGALPAGAAPPPPPGDEAEEITLLCAALERVAPGETIPVRLSGILLRGFEHSVFFDPEQPVCTWDVQPSAWAEIGPQVPGRDRLPRGLWTTTAVTLRGKLHGPPALGPDDPSLNPIVAYANRVAGRRYGHRGAFRTKLAVEEILSAEPAPDRSARRAVWNRPDSGDEPRVTSAGVPGYPKHARRAGLSGEVALQVVVEGGEVVSTTLLSGDRLLAIQAAADVETWKLPPESDTRFTTLFVYRLERRPAGAARAPRVELELPWLVRVTAAEDGW